MLIAHQGRTPAVDPSAWAAPDASLVGDVSIGAGSRVLWGARIIGEGGGKIRIGSNCIVVENAIVRATPRHHCSIGDHCLIGPAAHLVGATLEDEVFVATGAAIFHGAHLGKGSEVRVHATVHLRTRLAAGHTVPIGWVAVGDPAEILPPAEHERTWAAQERLDFPGFVYGSKRGSPELMRRITGWMAEMLGRHRGDTASPRD
ncbi:MAG: gamma carbonic anhydrase family protein [Acetobacteraceae bacterium]